jgi:hypothetical protein
MREQYSRTRVSYTLFEDSATGIVWSGSALSLIRYFEMFEDCFIPCGDSKGWLKAYINYFSAIGSHSRTRN